MSMLAPWQRKLLAATEAMNFTAVEFCEAVRDGAISPVGNIADGTALKQLLDALRLFLEATGEEGGELHQAICAKLEELL